MAETQSNQEGSYKKIQNYIFNFNDLLGKGNFSKVYKAHNEVTSEIVAIKIVELNSLKSKKLQQLLFSEIQILKKLNHPNVMKCFQVFTSNRNCYIITQLCNQGDLQTKLKNRKGMKEYQAEKYITDIFKGLIYLANNHVVHRDLKVANIFILNGSAKIADFGFAKITKFKFKDINIGSPIYMSPEGLIDNVYGPKTDVWAFGMLIYELLHGETPFSHCKSQSELKYNMSIPIGWSQLKPELSNQIKEVILKCLQVDENKRISVFQLQSLPFFKKRLSSSPAKILSKEKSATALSYDFRHNSSVNKLNYEEPNKSFGSFTQQTFKQRIKTQNQFNTFKRNTRQYSEITAGRHNLIRDSLSPALKQDTKQSNSHIKTPAEEQNILKFHQTSIDKYKSTNQESFQYRDNPSKHLIQTHKDTSIKQNILLSTAITFKECVNILHYCRLIFKHLVLMQQIHFGDDNQKSIFKRWLASILKVLIRQITENKVICEGQNVQSRQKKLQEVTNEYIKKYTKELNLDLSKARLQESLIINYQKIQNYFTSIFQMIDQIVEKETNNKSLIHLGHSMIIICYTTKILKYCYEERRYKSVQKLKEIQEFLNSNKIYMDFPSYQWYKKKYSMEGG